MNEKEEFIHYFREVQPKFSRFYTRILANAHLTLPQYALLNQLVSRNAVSMTKVSNQLHITKPAVTSLVDRLEKTGFLKRLPHAKDRRVSLLQILPKGEKAVRKMQAEALNLLLKAFDPLNSAERKIITRFYALISETIDEVLASPKNKK